MLESNSLSLLSEKIFKEMDGRLFGKYEQGASGKAISAMISGLATTQKVIKHFCVFLACYFLFFL